MNAPAKKQSLLFAIITLCIVGSANAQHSGSRQASPRTFDRGGSRSGGFGQGSSANRQSSASFDHQSRHEAFDRPALSSTVRQFPASGSRDVTLSRSQRFDNSNVAPRSFNRRVDQPGVNNTFNRPQTQRNINVYNNNRVVNNYRYAPGYNYAPRRYAFIGAPRYSVLPHSAISIRFGGYPYYYHSGLFFGFYAGYYQPVFAPIGIRISVLPIGYYPFYIGPSRYYYYDGVYYRNYNNQSDEYEVVDAPLGAQVSTLPKGATVATINGEKFYEFNGTYYKEGVNNKNEVVYTIVGKYGHVNNTDESIAAAPQMGDIVSALPDGCKEVTINGEQLYVSPDSTYYKVQTYDGTISYKIVGVGSKE